MNLADVEKLIKQHMKKELNIDTEQIEHFTIFSTFGFPKNDAHTIERYPIVDKSIKLIETEYYIDKIGHRRIYAVEHVTNRFMDVNQDTLELILKTNKQMMEMQNDIDHLDFFKADNKDITCQRVSIKYDSEDDKEIINKTGKPRIPDYTLPSRRKAELMSKQ